MNRNSYNETIDNETKIYYSRNIIMLSRITTGLAFLGSIIVVIVGEWIGLLFLLGTSFALYHELKKTYPTEPIITLNAKGIRILNDGFTSWKNIKNVQVVSKRRHKSKSWYLKIEFLKTDNQEHIVKDFSLKTLDTDPHKIESLIEIYRKRYLKYVERWET